MFDADIIGFSILLHVYNGHNPDDNLNICTFINDTKTNHIQHCRHCAFYYHNHLNYKDDYSRYAKIWREVCFSTGHRTNCF